MDIYLDKQILELLDKSRMFAGLNPAIVRVTLCVDFVSEIKVEKLLADDQ